MDQAGRYIIVIDQGPYSDPVSATPALTVSIVADRETAMPLGSLQRGRTESPYQSESFTFDGIPGQALLLQNLSTATPSADLALVDPGGHVIATSTAGDQGSEPIVLTNRGVHRLRAGGNGSVGDFRFRVSNLDTAASLSAGLPRTGRFDDPAAALAYRISATVGQRFQVSLVSGDDSLVRRRVYSSAGVILADSVNGRDTFTANQTADFLVVVDAPGATADDDLSFALVIDDQTAGTVSDSGDDIPLSGNIAAGGIDEHTFTATAGVGVRLRKIQFDSNVLRGELISPSGESIALDRVFAFPESGSYTFRVQGILPSDVGDYQLVFDRIDPRATEAVFVDRVSGTLSQGDAIVRRLSLTAGQRIAFDGGGDDVAGSRVRVYDPNRDLLLDASGDADDLFSAPVSGEYLLVADSADAATTDYSFRLLEIEQVSQVAPGLPVFTTLNDGNDWEMFQFSAAAGQRLYARGGLSRFQSWTLYDPFLNEIFSRPADALAGLGDFELELDHAGTYVLAFDSSRTVPQTFSFVTHLSIGSDPIVINPYASGSGTTIAYDPVFNVPIEMVDDLDRATRSTIDPSNGNLLSMTQIVGSDDATSAETDDLTSTYTYTTFGLVDRVTDPMGRVTDYDYDARGNVIRQTLAAGTIDESIVSFEYDLAGNVSAMIDGRGNRTEYEYDSRNRVLVMRNALRDEVRYSYDARGNRLESTDQRGHTWAYTYDALDRVETIIDPLDQVRATPMTASAT